MKDSSNLIKLTISLIDLTLISAAFYTAYWLRFGNFKNNQDLIWLYYFSAPLILFLLSRHIVMGEVRFRSLANICRSVLASFLVAGAVSSTVLYLSKTTGYSRLLFLNYFSLAALFILLERLFIKIWFDAYLCRGHMNIPIAVIGFGKQFEEITTQITKSKTSGITLALVLDPREVSPETAFANIRNAVIDEVYLIYPAAGKYSQQLQDLLKLLETLGIPIRLAFNLEKTQDYYGQYLCKLGSFDGLMLAPYNLDPDQLIVKRIMDIVGSVLGLILLALVFPIVAIAIKLDSSGPLIFSQLRIGKNGRVFTLYKFRSMYRGAEGRKKDLLAYNIHSGPIFKMHNDPRITRVGRVLRKYNLDELPQFWNIFLGDMSMVGTRPPTADEVAQYKDHHFRRISIKPGLTGMWQVSGRNSISNFEDVVALDVKYIKNWNIWLDMKIVCITLIHLIFKTNRQGP